MGLENLRTYSQLPEEEKKNFKQVGKDGGFVRKEAVEDYEVAHRIALLENDAFGELEESIERSGLSVNEIIEKLGTEELKYDEKRKLLDLLFQNADLARLKGSPIDDKLGEILKKTYVTLSYSEVLTKKIVDGIEEGDVNALGEVLKDEKIKSNWKLMDKVLDDNQRQAVFAICKERISSACLIIATVDDLDLAVKMYSEALTLADKESYSDSSSLTSIGSQLVEKLFKGGRNQQLVELVGEGVLTLSHCEKIIHKLGNEQKTIINFIKNSDDIRTIRYALKFITDKQLLSELEEGSDSLVKLSNKERVEVAEFAGGVMRALDSEPEIIVLSELHKDEFDKDFGNRVAKNKFVVGIDRRTGKYVLAASNVGANEYHRNIFQNISPTIAQSGGYIGVEEESGKTKVRMVRSSGDYGFYSKELLEHYRPFIVTALQDVLRSQNVDLSISESSDYE